MKKILKLDLHQTKPHICNINILKEVEKRLVLYDDIKSTSTNTSIYFALINRNANYKAESK